MNLRLLVVAIVALTSMGWAGSALQRDPPRGQIVGPISHVSAFDLQAQLDRAVYVVEGANGREVGHVIVASGPDADGASRNWQRGFKDVDDYIS